MAKKTVGPIALLFKLGPKIGTLLLKLLKGLKVGKIGLAAASLGAYSYVLTWQFACLILFMLFVHESGHIWAMKRCGMHTKGIYFIPFFGAAAVTDESFNSRNEESFIAIMGPIWGLVLSFLTALVYVATDNPFFAAAASWMAMVNLFNLLPINPLDGGRILKSIAFSVHSHLGYVFLVIGMLAAGILAFTMHIGLFVFLLFIGALELIVDIRKQSKMEQPVKSFELGERARIAMFMDEFYAGVEYGIAKSPNLSRREAEIHRDEQREEGEGIRTRMLEKLQEDLKERRAKMTSNTHVMPPMTTRQIIWASFLFVTVAGLLYGIMSSMNHVPGAAAAMELLKDQPS